MYRKPDRRLPFGAFLLYLCLCAPVALSAAGRGGDGVPGADAGVSRGQWSLGTIHSVKGVGFCADVFRDADSFCSFTLTADLPDIINGQSSTPGLKATCHYNLILREWKEGKYRLYAGPGLTAGHVRNLDIHLGAMGGVSADAGLRVSCLHSLSVSVELQADFALLFKNRYNPDMGLYRAGFLHSYYPHVRIQYDFGR